MEPAVFIGVDVGGTTMSGGLVTDGGEVLSAIQVPTHRDGKGTAVETLLGLVAELVSHAAATGIALAGVGVGLPGLVDGERGVMTGMGNLVPEFTGNPLAERIQAKVGTPVFVDNDVNALALGEWMFGLGRGAASFAVLAIGSGIGGGLILDGRLVRGKDGYAGEFGHMPINFDGPQCICGGRGCLCVYLAGSYMAWEAQDHVTRQPDSAVLALAKGDPDAITSQMIFEAAAAGDTLARSMVNQACRALGAGLGMIVNGLNPDVILVTGGVVRSLLPLEHEVLRLAGEYAFADALRGTRIHLVAADKRQTVRGGAALVLYERARRSVRRSAQSSAGPTGPGKEHDDAQVRRRA